jgi:hypothetical protein
MELNLEQEKPLSRIIEVAKHDEDFDEQLNDRIEEEEVSIEERANLDLTRTRLSAWFPA